MRCSSLVCLGLLTLAACGGAPSRADTGAAGSGDAASELGAVAGSSGIAAVPTGPSVAAVGQAAASDAGLSAGAPALEVAQVPMSSLGVGGAAGTVAPTMQAQASAGSGGVAAPGMPLAAACPAPPAGATSAQRLALEVINGLRLAAGAACVNLDLTIGAAAEKHCEYYAMNSSDPTCTDVPHREVMGCPGFTGATPMERMRAAGFDSSDGGEIMAFLNDAARAIQMWVDSVWHRIPLLDPATTVLGYGSATGCDVIDFGPGMRSEPARVAVYPYAGQQGVTTSFDGRFEAPMPPEPITGWPSSNPISVYAQGLSITEHQLFVDGDSTPVPHVWLDSTSDLLPVEQQRLLRHVVFMYANEPFLPDTTYRVKISGTYAGGPLMREWTFTTGAAPVRKPWP